jgi:tetratricopeptide (TPR) repeat protein
MTKDAKTGIVLGVLFIFVIAFIINALPGMRPPPSDGESLHPGTGPLVLPGAVLFVLGVILAVAGKPSKATAEVAFGSVSFKLTLPAVFLGLGVLAICYAAFLESRTTWTSLLREELVKSSVSEEVARSVPAYLRLLASRQESTKKREVPQDERLLGQAESLYESGAFDECVQKLKEINTQTDAVLDGVLYYSIMARYHMMEIATRRYEHVSQSDREDLESRFERFMAERPESKWFCTIHYWLGHFYLQINNDPDSALEVFDNIIADYFYSSWVQGCLYYSAILHHQKGTPEDRETAVKRLKILSAQDGPLKVVEVNRDCDGAQLARALLKKWGAAIEDKSEKSGTPSAD